MGSEIYGAHEPARRTEPVSACGVAFVLTGEHADFVEVHVPRVNAYVVSQKANTYCEHGYNVSQPQEYVN